MKENLFLGAFFTVNETLYLYHYGLLERILELVLWDPVPESTWWITLPSQKGTGLRNIDDIGKTIRRYKVSMIYISGVDPVNHPTAVKLVRDNLVGEGVYLGATASCVRASRDKYWQRNMSLLDYISLYLPLDSELSRKTEKKYVEDCVRDILGFRRGLELHVSSMAGSKLVNSVAGGIRWETPAHIHGGETDELEALLKDRVLNLYVHGHVMDEVSQTRCWGCESIVVTRINRVPRKIFLNENRCARCGERVLYTYSGEWGSAVLRGLVGRRVVVSWLIS